MFNFWRPYPFLKPKKDGWYQCSIKDAENPEKEYVMDLHYRTYYDKWYNVRRQNVFDGYKVYKSGREPMEYNRVYTDSLCVRLDVVAWKKLPKVYWFGRKRKDKKYIR